MAQLPMYPGQVNSPITELVNAIDEVQDTIEVSDGLALPDAPNIAVIGTSEDAETIQYGSKAGNVLSDVVRGFQGTARAWPAGQKVARYFTAYDYDTLRKNLIAHLDEEATETELGHVYQSEDVVANTVVKRNSQGRVFAASNFTGKEGVLSIVDNISTPFTTGQTLTIDFEFSNAAVYLLNVVAASGANTAATGMYIIRVQGDNASIRALADNDYLENSYRIETSVDLNGVYIKNEHASSRSIRATLFRII